MQALLIAIAILIMGGQQAVAQQDPFSGAFLLTACKNYANNTHSDDWLNQGVCAGVIQGVGFATAHVYFCPPQNVANRQQVRVVIQYMENNSRDQHLSLAELAVRAWAAAWPCPTQPQRR